MTGAEDVAAATPVLQIVSGSPSEEELAAITAVVVASRRARPTPHAPYTGTVAGGWRSYWHTVRNPLLPGREAWRSTFRR